MKKSILTLACVLLASVVVADELHLKDGSVVRGKLVEIKPNESYRIRTKDGSEFVYTVDKVHKVDFSKEEKPTETAPSQSWGVISGGTGPSRMTSSGWDNTTGQFGSGQTTVKDASFGIGLGKYGLIGAELNLRSSDQFGFSLGAGGYYWMVDYGEDDSGFDLAFGVKPKLYFTPRNQDSQSCLYVPLYYCQSYGTAFGVAWGYEKHRPGGGGWDFSLGLIFAPDAEEKLAEEVFGDEYYADRIDFTWIPILIEFGFFF